MFTRAEKQETKCWYGDGEYRICQRSNRSGALVRKLGTLSNS